MPGLPALDQVETPEDQRLRLVIYIDNFNIHPFNRNRVMRELRVFLTQKLSRGDSVMLVSYDRSLKVRRNFTADPDLIAVGNALENAIPIVAIVSVFVFLPIAIAVARLIWRRATNAPRGAVTTDHATQQKLDHLQQAVDTIAIEVERISEGQRFVTKLMSDRSLGAGAAEPVRLGAKNAIPSERG